MTEEEFGKKFMADARTYQVTCRVCLSSFDGRTNEYEGHVCHQESRDSNPDWTTLPGKFEQPKALGSIAPQNVSTGKTPFQCPLCQGDGLLLTALGTIDVDSAMAENLATHKKCHGCAGTGIVWG